MIAVNGDPSGVETDANGLEVLTSEECPRCTRTTTRGWTGGSTLGPTHGVETCSLRGPMSSRIDGATGTPEHGVPGDVLVRVTDLQGRHVRAADGGRVGRIVDVTISHGSERPELRRIVIRGAHGVRAVDSDLVERLGPSEVQLRCSSDEFDRYGEIELAPTELRLGQDVIDAQIVDLAGHHLVRASDVLLARFDGAVGVVGVDVGFGAVLRRLGLRRLGGRVRDQVVPWSELHLTSRRGHEVQLESRSPHLARRSALDLAHLLERLSVEHATDVLQQTPVDGGAVALALSHDEVAGRLLASVPEQTAEELLDALPATRAEELRARLAATPLPRRRSHRTHGWKRHAPVGPSSEPPPR